ncbi:MAG: ABC transporter ATP-binding protein [Chloroflexi bacterium]|nr:ABC transporter ATP-binding protein [Chloroflexota bacterium]
MDFGGQILQVIDLWVTREEREILRGVHLAVARQSVHAVLGLNGSGKSTLAYALMGCAGYKPSRGRILFEGQEITELGISERGKLGITLAWQEPARFEGLTVERYLSLGQREPDARRVRAALEAVNLDASYLQRFVDESLSGGERKRVELAAVYAMAPKLAILDEPDSGIDTLSLDDIGRLIHRMAQEGSAVLLISHRDEVVAIADTASLICEGQIVQTGNPDKVCERYARCCRPCGRSERVEEEAEYERL